MFLWSLLGAFRDANDADGTKPRPGSPKGREKGNGEGLLVVIRLMIKMDPEERTILIEFLKALE